MGTGATVARLYAGHTYKPLVLSAGSPVRLDQAKVAMPRPAAAATSSKTRTTTSTVKQILFGEKNGHE